MMSFCAIEEANSINIEQQNDKSPGATIRLTLEYRINPAVTSRSQVVVENLMTEYTINSNFDSQSNQQTRHANYRQINRQDATQYATNVIQELDDHLPVKHLPVEPIPNSQRAHLVRTPTAPSSDDEKVDEVLIRDTIVQHISEDEKSTSSEEVVFEEWSEEFRCRRTDEYDQKTNQLLRTVIDETSERVKSDVIKEEYREKNERIKGHRSYDVVKEVFRRIPAHLVDPSKHTVVSTDPPRSHLYEEIAQPPPSNVSATMTRSPSSHASSPRYVPIERPPRDRHWSSEDIYVTEIVYDPDVTRQYETISTLQDPPTPPSYSSNYDRFRPGQYPTMPPTTQTTVSTVPKSNYDRISSIVPTSTHYAERREIFDQEPVISEEYTIEVEQTDPPRRTGFVQENEQKQSSDNGQVYERPSSFGPDRSSYQDLTRIINEASQRSSTARTSDWRNKLKETYTPTSDEDHLDQWPRSRDSTKRSPTSSNRVIDERPTPPKRSSSSSSIIDERRARFEQYQQDSRTNLSPDQNERPEAGRVGALKNAFESSSSTDYLTRDESNKSRTPITTSFTEERRKLFEQQESSSTVRRPTTDSPSDQQRTNEIHTVPSVIADRVSHFESSESKTPVRVQTNDRLGRSEFEQIKSSLESSITRTVEPATNQSSLIESTIRGKPLISSIDSEVDHRSPPIHQSTPKSTIPVQDDDAGHESEDELSDPTNNNRKQEQLTPQDNRRRGPKSRLRDFSQSTPNQGESAFVDPRTRSTFNEESMEQLLSHVPPSKGKALLIELSPRPSHESPITSTLTKPMRDPNKTIIGSDSGIFEYSTATSHHPGTSSSSWRNVGSSSIIDDPNRTSTARDSGAYVDSSMVTPTNSLRFGRRQNSETDQTTIHGGDDSVSRSTYKYETEASSNDINQQTNQTRPRYARRQLTRSPPSEYENIANFHSGTNTQRKVPIVTQSRAIGIKPIFVDEIETTETEILVECQVQRTHEIKESVTKTEGPANANAPRKVVTTTTTTTTTTRSPETSSDETTRTITPSRRVLLNERPSFYEANRTTNLPVTIRSTRDNNYTPITNFRQDIHNYRENGNYQTRMESPPSDSMSYSHMPTAALPDEELVRIEETQFKPIQRDRSHDSLLQSPTSRSNARALSAGPRTMEITSFSPQNQVTFNQYAPNEIIAIVRVPELSNGTPVQTSPQSHSFSSTGSTIRQGTSESGLNNNRTRKDDERSRLHYQRIHTTSYNPPLTTDNDYSTRQSRSRTGPYERSTDYSSAVNTHPRSSSYHSMIHDQERTQQRYEQVSSPVSNNSAYQRQVQRRSGSLGNILGANIDFEIEIEKRPPITPEQPTSVSLNQASSAIVTTSRDGRVAIQNVAARPGNTVVINSDFHSSDRSLNRSSGYFSSDELRSQGLTANYSSDEQSSGAGIISQANGSIVNHPRRYRNNDQNGPRLPTHYRPRSTHYQHLNNENFDQVNQMVQRYHQSVNSANHDSKQPFHETINELDKFYTNVDMRHGENSHQDHMTTQMSSEQTGAVSNRRRQLSPNQNEYTKRYTSTGFQSMSSPSDYTQSNSTLRHLVSPPSVSTINTDKRRNITTDSSRALSDNENLYRISSNERQWGSTSLNDLAGSVPLRPSQSLSSSGILADYTTPGSMSPNSGFGSTQNVVLQRNRLNNQQQIVQRNRTSVKQVKQKSAAKKKFNAHMGQYTDEDEDNDSAGGHDSPLSDSGHQTKIPSNGYSNYSHHHHHHQ